MKTASSGTLDVTPSARRLTGSLRDIGYDFVAAIADLVDNSVSANAERVDIEIVFEGADSYVVVADNGNGMTEGDLAEALRFGSRREYALGELGRYGLGLKTASLSQCRRLTVVTRRSMTYRRLAMKTLDLDHIERTDRWQIIDPPGGSHFHRCLEWIGANPGTVVFWEVLDRVLPERRLEGGWARRRLDQLASRTREYLGMVFHRFLQDQTQRGLPLVITVNGEKVEPWDPFAPLEEHRLELAPQSFEIVAGDVCGTVLLRRYVLPPKSLFSSVAEFDRLSGPLKWNRQQGVYIYRADRLIQHGGWCGIRAADEHTKIARASVDFQTDLDPLFQINVAKMRVSLPAQVRTLFERPIHELCHRADAAYRNDAHERNRLLEAVHHPEAVRGTPSFAAIGPVLLAAALDAGEHAALERIMEKLRDLDPSMAADLGW